MPIYEYKCTQCQYQFAVLQRLGEGNAHLTCEKCGAPHPTKQFSVFASTAQGSGAKSTAGAPSGGFT